MENATQAPQTLSDIADAVLSSAANQQVEQTQTETKTEEPKQEATTEKPQTDAVGEATRRKQKEVEFRKAARLAKQEAASVQKQAAELAEIKKLVDAGDAEALAKKGIDLRELNKKALFKEAEKKPLDPVEEMKQKLAEMEKKLEEKEAAEAEAQDEQLYIAEKAKFVEHIETVLLKDERYELCAAFNESGQIDVPARLEQMVLIAQKSLENGEDTGLYDEDGEPRLPSPEECIAVVEKQLEKFVAAASKTKKMGKPVDSSGTSEKRGASMTQNTQRKEPAATEQTVSSDRSFKPRSLSDMTDFMLSEVTKSTR